MTAAALNSTGSIYLHGSSANQALLDVTAGSAGFGTAGVLSGTVRLVGDSAIEFNSSEITSLAANAQLHLNGNDAFIEDSKAPGSNSALTGLASIGAGAFFGLHNKAAVSTTGSLVNDGHIHLDFAGGDGGSSLTLAGALTNSGSLTIGNRDLSASDNVTVASLDNTGSISLTSFQRRANQALLDVTAGSAGFGAAGVLSGNVELTGDSAIEFASGQITSLADGAQLHLTGKNAFIEDSTALGSNSALTGLASIGCFGATLMLRDKAALSTTGALVNDGTVDLLAGTLLDVTGALTNTGTLIIGSAVCAVGTLSNSGSIFFSGTLDVTRGVAGFGTAGTLTGSVTLVAGGGGRRRISEWAKLDDCRWIIVEAPRRGTAFIEYSTALGSNSALTGIADIAGSLTLSACETVSTNGSVTNIGFLSLTEGSINTAGSTLSIAGALTNTGRLSIKTESQLPFSPDSVTAKSLVNSGTIDLTGGRTDFAALDVLGATTNNGSISITTDTEELAGAVVGTGGSFSLTGANLQFDSGVAAGQTINESGTNALTLERAQSFAATISGFGTGDTIDATNFHAPPATTYDFVENIAGTGGTLSLHDGSLTANIQMTGDYSKSSFTLAPDSGTGTLVKFV